MSAGAGASRPRRIHVDEVGVDDQVVKSLLASQFPDWAKLELRQMATTGTDNAIYRLGEHLGIRLPRIHWAVGQIAKEREWLPQLAPDLPAPVPEPLALGEPGSGYPYPWLVYRWLEGADAMASSFVDWRHVAPQVAELVIALQSIDTTNAPSAGMRGGPLAPYDGVTRAAMAHLDGLIDVRRALAVWQAAVSAEPWSGPPVWVHGDLLPGNVLVGDGSLAGIIDWSAAGIGDPACEAGWPGP
jgi:aminoglycoside phosphotransferase (APT) family kinase protein